MTRPVNQVLDNLDWSELPEQAPPADGTPHATHVGALEVKGFKIRVYRLSDGQRIIDVRDLVAFLEGES